MLDQVVSAEIVVPGSDLPADLLAVDLADMLDCDVSQVVIRFGEESSARVVMASGDEGTSDYIEGRFTTDTSFLDGVARTVLMQALGIL